jgi:formate hydrogenlyase transcriptional activator
MRFASSSGLAYSRALIQNVERMAAVNAGDALERLAASLARAGGRQFFSVLAEHLAAVLDAAEVLICESASDNRARTLAVWRAGELAPNYDYGLDGTPCAAVRAGQSLTIELPTGDYPGAARQSGGYFGTPLASNDGAVLGHLCAYTERPLQLTSSDRAVCSILASRAAAELRLVHIKRERALLRAQTQQLRAEIAAVHHIEDFVGVSAAHRRVLDEIRHAALSAADVLVTGEPGTGKELVARTIHASSSRAAKPFVKIDCSALNVGAALTALPQTMLLCNGGTLFLDEVGVLAPELQSRLVAALPEHIQERPDGAETNVRFIASTHSDLRRSLTGGQFRQDLYERLGSFIIALPPLRARIEDIPLLVQSFIRRHARRLGRRVDSIDPQSLAELASYAWPGNIRELANLVERSLVMENAPVIKLATGVLATTAASERSALVAATDSDSATATRSTLAGPVDFDDTLSTGLHVIQREHILRVLHMTHWIIEGNSGAALKLGLKPATLRHRMKKLGISRAQNSPAT